MISKRSAPEKLRLAALLGAWALLGAGLVWAALLEISETSQLLLAGVLLALLAVLKLAAPKGAARLFFVVLALFVSFRYMAWRTTHTVPPAAELFVFIPGLMLYAAELYGFLIAVLGVFVNVNPVTRSSPPLPADPTRCPTVDVFIPTYNEDPDIVEATIYAACRLDYPVNRFRVYVLDDGGTAQKLADPDPARAVAAYRRAEQLKRICIAAGATYLTRPRNEKAKAGNINAALPRSKSELVVIFDADHVPAADFLQKTVGFFLCDPKLFLVQTPHFFANPDPLERNLQTFGRMPSEQEMFYSEIQRGLDFWNAAFFCGSAAVLRRARLDEIGGVAEDTVTEDAETALKLHARGYNSVFVSQPLVCGLQPETFSGFVTQRTRWTQGMIQIMLLHNPLFQRGLSLAQRLCYLNAALFWFFPFARIAFLAAPLCYLLFGLQIYVASATEFVAYTVPHMAASLMMMNVMYGRSRWPFISELYELIQSIFTARAVLGTLVSPRKPKFRVTPKGEHLDGDFLSPLAPPFYIILGLLAVGYVFAGYRYLAFPAERDILAVVTLWNVFNTLLIGGALGVVCESRQRRRWPRLATARPVNVLIGGVTHAGEIVDLSGGGARIALPGAAAPAEAGPELIQIELDLRDRTGLRFDAFVRSRSVEGGRMHLGIEFAARSEQERGDLVELFYSDSSRWEAFLASHKRPPGVLAGMAIFAVLGTRYLWRALRFPFEVRPRTQGAESAKPALTATRVAMALVCILSGTAAAHAADRAQGVSVRLDAMPLELATPASGAPAGAVPLIQAPAIAEAAAPQVDPAAVQSVSLADLIAQHEPVRLEGEFAELSVPFLLASAPTVPVQVRITYLAAIHNMTERSRMRIVLNGVAIAEAPIEAFDAPDLISIGVPGRMFRAGQNTLVIQTRAVHRVACGVPATFELWTRIDPEGSGLVFRESDSDGPDAASFLAAAPTLGRGLVIRSAPDEHGLRPRLEAGALLVQAATVLSGSASLRVRSDVIGESSTGRVVYLGTRAALIPALPKSVTDRIVGPYAGVHRDAQGSSYLVVSGLDWSGVRKAAEQVAAAAAQPVTVAPEDTTIPFAALGFRTISMTGQRQVADLTFRLPADLYTGTDDPALLRINAAHISGLGAGAAINVSANSTAFSSLRLTDGGKLIESAPLKLPSRLLRGGLNTIRFDLVAPPAAADACEELGGERRLSVFDDSTLHLPSLVRIGRQPDLRLLLEAGYPFAGNAAERAGTIVLAAADPETVSAGWAAAAALARGAGSLIHPLAFSVGVPLEPELARGNLFLVGAAADLRGVVSARGDGAFAAHLRTILKKVPAPLGAPARGDTGDAAFADLVRQARGEARAPAGIQAGSRAADERPEWEMKLRGDAPGQTVETESPHTTGLLEKWKDVGGDVLLGWWSDLDQMPALGVLSQKPDLGILMGGSSPRGDGATHYVLTSASPASLAERAGEMLQIELRRKVDGDLFVWGPSQAPASYRVSRIQFSDPWPTAPGALSMIVGVFVSTNVVILIGFVLCGALLFVAVVRRVLRGYQERCRAND